MHLLLEFGIDYVENYYQKSILLKNYLKNIKPAIVAKGKFKFDRVIGKKINNINFELYDAKIKVEWEIKRKVLK